MIYPRTRVIVDPRPQSQVKAAGQRQSRNARDCAPERGCPLETVPQSVGVARQGWGTRASR